MSKILLVSIQAGGGHKTAMYSLGEILHKYAPTAEFDYFISENEDLDKTHFFLNTKLPWAYELGYRLAETKLFGFIQKVALSSTTRKLRAELTKSIIGKDYKLIISTHYLLTECLLQVRQKHNADFKILAYVPDFDLTSVHFPRVHGETADAVIAQNFLYLNKLQKKYQLQHNQVQVAGFIPRPEFTKIREMPQAQARKKLNEQGFNLLNPVGENDFTMVFTGGSSWVNYAYKAVEATLKNRKINWKNTQLIIICGNNKDAFQKYSALAKQYSDRKLHVLPFMNYEQMALVYRSANLVTLASIAPATLNELLEVGNAPIVVHHNNPGQERANLQFAKENKIIEHIPRVGAFVKFVVRLQKDRKFAESVDQSFRQRAQVTREILRSNSIKTANFILNILNK